MPIPAEHRRQLQHTLGIHERLLNRAIRDQRLHELSLRLGRDPRVLAVLDEFSDNRELFRAAARDPRRFAQEREIDLPSDVNVVFREKGPAMPQAWFVGFRSSSGLLYGYEGGEGGRGWVKGEPEDPEDGENGGETGGGGGGTPP
jgi:hypothetical protein